MTRDEWKKLEPGDVVARFSSGQTYIVTRKDIPCYRGFLCKQSLYGISLQKFIQGDTSIMYLGCREKFKVLAKGVYKEICE